MKDYFNTPATARKAEYLDAYIRLMERASENMRAARKASKMATPSQ